MNNLKTYAIALGTFLIFSFFLQIQYTSNADESGLIGLYAIAQSSDPIDDCTSFGYRDWDHPLSFKSGYDCLCKPKSKVKNTCT